MGEPVLNQLFSAVSHFSLAKSADAQSEVLAQLVDSVAAPNSKFRVIGEGFHLSADLEGTSAIKKFLRNTLVPAYYNNVDVAQAPAVSDPPEVIGNPSAPDASFAIVFHGELVAKSGKPWVNDAVLVVKTDSQAKWVDVKLYLDTLQLQNHINGSA